MKPSLLIPTLTCVAVSALSVAARSVRADVPGPAIVGDFSFQEPIAGVEPVKCVKTPIGG